FFQRLHNDQPTQPSLRHMREGDPRIPVAESGGHLEALLCASPILVCPTRHDPCPFVRQITNAGGGIFVQVKIKEQRTRREVKRRPRRGATMAGLLRRSLRWKLQLAEKTRSRHHNACDPTRPSRQTAEGHSGEKACNCLPFNLPCAAPS